MNNGCNEENNCCYFHPREVVVGVCPFCLNERLLMLASSHQGRRRSSSSSSSRCKTTTYKAHQNDNIHHINNVKKPPINFQKIFDFSSLLHRLEFRPWKPENFSYGDHDHDVSTSQEDSFISIKFEDNGMASWEKNNNNNTVSKVSLENCNVPWKKNHSLGKEQAETKTVIEHGKPRASSLRWRKRIGHLFQLMRWKKSNKGTVCHVSSKVEGVKVRKGWIRTLTKKRTM
ncbi:hypothetical protein L484_004391 [Morus notabilis]|uniref:Uncharacterized protein n=1 Tax=Morus notabilis TaxID=981085 RepID=W9RU46_9ROSA|nr:uncharacterized protein LOC21387893 [Morus notabilis]EXC10213.1 hypothetical protein L484_004391 [Morus notabilis]